MINPKDTRRYVVEIPKKNINTSLPTGGDYGYYSTKDRILTKDTKLFREH